MKFLSRFMSVAFHPLLMATYSSILFYFIQPSIFGPYSRDTLPHLIGVMFTTTFLVPGFSLLFLKLTKRISSLRMNEKEERLFPFFSIACFYALSTYLFYSKINISGSVIGVMCLTTLMIFILAIINIWMKISIHSAGIWGLCGILSAIALRGLYEVNLVWILGGLFLTAGLTSAARLYLQYHTPKEVWYGAFFGFIFFLFGLLYLL